MSAARGSVSLEASVSSQASNEFGDKLELDCLLVAWLFVCLPVLL
jgi:hypothetical protein